MIFVVVGKIRGKGRPRYSGITHTVYTPKETVAYEKQIARAYKEAGGEMFPEECEIRVTVKAYFAIPKSYSSCKKTYCMTGAMNPMKKPDIDNILKVVLDGLNGIAYSDDKNVIAVSCMKKYGQSEYLEIGVTEYKA